MSIGDYVSVGILPKPAPLTFTRQPFNKTVAKAGETVTFAVTAIGAVYYAWLCDLGDHDLDISDWTMVSEEDVFTFTAMPGMDGYRFRAVAVAEDDSYAFSTTATLTCTGLVEVTKTDDIVTIENGPVTIKSLKVDINAVQSGSGDPSSENVRPITGWSSVGLAQTGANLWDETIANGFWNSSTGDWSDRANYLASANLIPCKPSTSIYMRAPANLYLNFYDASGTHIGSGLPYNKNTVFTTPSDAYYFTWWQSEINYGSETYQNDISFNYPSTDHDYHKHAGTPYTISLEDTVYGGMLDVTTGVLTVTHGNIASYDGETINEPWISSMDVYESGATPTTGAQVVYPLIEPLTVTLDPVTINPVFGPNNIFADCGDITVTYKDWPAEESDQDELLGLSIQPLNPPDTLQPSVLDPDVIDMLDIQPLDTEPEAEIDTDI